MSDWQKFATRDVIEAGIKVPLACPDGTPSDDWLVIRNFRSDGFRKVNAEIAARDAQKGTPGFEVQQADAVKRCAALIAGWSFKAECTPENIAKFLADCPTVPEQVFLAATQDKHFFASGATPSSSGVAGK